MLASPLFSISQQDSIQEVQSVLIQRPVLKIKPLRLSRSSFYGDQIQQFGTQDAGELISKLAGSNLKSYGGLGGLKTISVRSLGGEQNSTIIDGFVQSNSQNGQINFAQIQSDNIIGIHLSIGDASSYLLPVSSQMAGSTINIQTFENTFGYEKFEVRSSLKMGSFGQKEGYIALKSSKKKLLLSCFGKLRSAIGDYPYQFQNGLSIIDSKRTNNGYQDAYFGITTGYKFKKSLVRLGYKGSVIDQELPGAAILYNSTADELLKTNDHSFFSDVNFDKNDIYYRAFSNFSANRLNYKDPSFFNNIGGIDVTYINNVARAGLSFASYKVKKLTFHGGFEMSYAQLESSDSTFSKPNRLLSQVLGGLDFKTTIGVIKGDISFVYSLEDTKFGQRADDVYKLQPFLSFQTKNFSKKHLNFKFWYRNSIRLPSFNELYYNNIGNNGLRPEIANQYNVGLEFVPIEKDLDVFIRTNLFYNQVIDKIMSVPTKNLFVWSTQNIQNVEIYGSELTITSSLRKGYFTYSALINYSYQKVLDNTPSSLTYKDQLAYSPEHTISNEVGVEYKKSGVRLSHSYVSYRYALNQNVEQNRIDGYHLFDVALFYNLPLKEKNELKLQLNIKNILDTPYAYIRSFVMPQRSFIISLNYAFR